MAFFAKLQSSVSGTGQVPIGAMLPRWSSTLPKGWLWCNGQTFESTLYPELAKVLGDTYGVSSGTTYYLPDTQGRVLIGAGEGSGLTNRVLGTKLGAETVVLTALESGSPIHSHSDTLTSVNHTHTTNNTGAAGGGTTLRSTSGRGTVSTGTRDPSTNPYTYTIANESSAATDPHDNMQPTIFYPFMIRAL